MVATEPCVFVHYVEETTDEMVHYSPSKKPGYDLHRPMGYRLGLTGRILPSASNSMRSMHTSRL